MNPDSSVGIYVTASVEAQCRMIAENRKIKEEENIKNSKVNALKRAARINLRATSVTKILASLPITLILSPHFRTIASATILFFKSGNSPIFPPICGY